MAYTRLAALACFLVLHTNAFPQHAVLRTAGLGRKLISSTQPASLARCQIPHPRRKPALSMCDLERDRVREWNTIGELLALPTEKMFDEIRKVIFQPRFSSNTWRCLIDCFIMLLCNHINNLTSCGYEPTIIWMHPMIDFHSSNLRRCNFCIVRSARKSCDCGLFLHLRNSHPRYIKQRSKHKEHLAVWGSTSRFGGGLRREGGY